MTCRAAGRYEFEYIGVENAGGFLTIPAMATIILARSPGAVKRNTE